MKVIWKKNPLRSREINLVYVHEDWLVVCHWLKISELIQILQTAMSILSRNTPILRPVKVSSPIPILIQQNVLCQWHDWSAALCDFVLQFSVSLLSCVVYLRRLTMSHVWRYFIFRDKDRSKTYCKIRSGKIWTIQLTLFCLFVFQMD